MNPKQAAQVIRDTVTMDQILGLYGYETKKGGYICCPFHGEKTPSLKVYKANGGWHCYGCGRGGSVIDFVKEHENCDFWTAVIAIDRALRLGLMDPREDVEEARRRAMLQHKLDEFTGAVLAYADAMIRAIDLQRVEDEKKLNRIDWMRKDRIQEITADEWTFWLNWRNEDDWNEYRREQICAFKEEVAAWRRRLRSPR